MNDFFRSLSQFDRQCSRLALGVHCSRHHRHDLGSARTLVPFL